MGWSRPRLQTCQLSPRAGRIGISGSMDPPFRALELEKQQFDMCHINSFTPGRCKMLYSPAATNMIAVTLV